MLFCLGFGERGIRVEEAGRVGRGGGTDLPPLLDRGGGTEAGAPPFEPPLPGAFAPRSLAGDVGADAFFAGVEAAFFAFALCSVRAAMGNGGSGRSRGQGR